LFSFNDRYDEISNYNFASGRGMGTGHFTQVVWKTSTKLGCGIGKGNRGVYVCCQYLEAGNYMGEYTKNVMPLK